MDFETVMENLDKREWDFSKGEKYAIKWWEDHGYSIVIRKRFISKDYCTISKGGFSFDYDLPLGDEKINYRKLMEQFERDFCLAMELDNLRREAARMGWSGEKGGA